MEDTLQSTNKTLAQTFVWMFLGLLSTGIIAAITYYTGAIVEIANSWKVILISQFAIVIICDLFFHKLSSGAVTLLFFGYSMITGLTFSTIFVRFELTSIAYALFATSAFFGILAFIGYKTDKDLSNFGIALIAALVVAFILTVVNLFLGYTTLDIVLNWVVLGVFAGLTAYDMNKVKVMSETYGYDQEKVAIYGAMQLYLDFINMFLRILEIFGKRNN